MYGFESNQFDKWVHKNLNITPVNGQNMLPLKQWFQIIYPKAQQVSFMNLKITIPNIFWVMILRAQSRGSGVCVCDSWEVPINLNGWIMMPDIKSYLAMENLRIRKSSISNWQINAESHLGGVDIWQHSVISDFTGYILM